MLGIIDYGVGNLFSLKSSLNKLGIPSEISSDKDFIMSCDRVILPGVGAFGDAANKLSESGLDKIVKKLAENGVPLLGICLGMQLLFNRSFEYGEHEGLSLIDGQVRYLGENTRLKIPHIGWNSLSLKNSPLFRYVDDGEYVYFVHSYHAVNCADSIIATAFYGADITAAVSVNNVYGTQFHPEKSGDTGLRILKAFGEL